jgi:hypothetical protein
MAPAVTREILLTYGSLAVSSIGNGTGVYTLAATAPAWVVQGGQIAFFGCSNSANNGVFVISTVAGAVVTVVNPSSVTEASGGLAAFPVAGPSNFSHHDKYKFKSSYKTRTYTFDVVFTGATSYANFLIYCTQAEAAFRTPRQRFRVSFSGTLFDDLNPAAASGGNTGFHQEPEIEKLGDDFDTSRSRGWRVTVAIQLPADLAGQSGRQDSSIRVDYDAARRRLITISGRYTALGVNNARAQYLASIGAYQSAIQSYVAGGDGSVYELIQEDATSDDIDKYLDFSRKYEELIYDQSGSGRDDAAIKIGRYNYTRQQIGPGDSEPATRRLEIITVEFECWIDKTVTTDLDGYWNSTIKGYLIAQAKSRFALGQMAIVDLQYKTEAATNRIFGHLGIQAQGSDSNNLIQSRYTTKIQINNGKVIIRVWDGNIWSGHVYKGPATKLRIKTMTMLSLGGGGGGDVGGGGSNPAAGAGGGGGGGSFDFANGFSAPIFGSGNSGAAQTALVQAALSDGPLPGEPGGPGAAPAGQTGWIGLSSTVVTTPITIGVGGYQISMTESETETVEQYIEAPAAGGGGPAGGPTPVAT